MGKVKELLMDLYEAGGYIPSADYDWDYVDRTKPVHSVYHIFGRKVGATEFLKNRLKRLRVKRDSDWELLLETNDLDFASDMEQYYQKKFGYHVDGLTYKEIKTMKKIKMHSTACSYGINQGFRTREQLREFLKDGVRFIDKHFVEFIFKPEDIDELMKIAEISKFRSPHKKYDFMFFGNDIENLIEELREKRMKIIGQNGNTGEHYSSPCTSHDKASEEECINQQKTLDDVFGLQKSLQMRFSETQAIGNESLTDTAMSAQRNLHAFLDEFMEYMNAIGGETDGVGKNAWKYWGKEHNTAKKMTLKDLSEKDLYDLKMEYVDMFHFFINWGLMVGMTGQELIDMYVIKNKENFKRQDEGYNPAKK